MSIKAGVSCYIFKQRLRVNKESNLCWCFLCTVGLLDCLLLICFFISLREFELLSQTVDVRLQISLLIRIFLFLEVCVLNMADHLRRLDLLEWTGWAPASMFDKWMLKETEKRATNEYEFP